MNMLEAHAERLVDVLADLLDIPPSYYEKARERYGSLADWFHRDGSPLLAHDPLVFPQGSFRYGTVIRPLLQAEEYDLDLVCELDMAKRETTQCALKEMVGGEIRAYASAQGLKSPAEEKKRCWRLDYADAVKFHMDILPAVPEDEETKQGLGRLIGAQGERPDLASLAVAITDRTDTGYRALTARWPMSNPKGFAEWFEGRMRAVAEQRMRALVEGGLYASVDDVPSYTWKTPLQRAIQLLKRHRDVMFARHPKRKPISMIITTLAARAYGGETNLHQLLLRFVEEVPRGVRRTQPRIPNPTNPGEDFADAWRRDPQLEQSFWDWCEELRVDLGRLRDAAEVDKLRRIVRDTLALDLPESGARELVESRPGASSPRTGTPRVVDIRTPPRPWGSHG